MERVLGGIARVGIKEKDPLGEGLLLYILLILMEYFFLKKFLKVMDMQVIKYLIIIFHKKLKMN